jgi:DNA repair photolyase
MQQTALFQDQPSRRTLPVIGEQKDIRYLARPARTILNSPESTGMEFWSINPYVGCAFGCAYCYARYAHRYAMDRATDGEHTELPPWLAFERRIFVKQNAPAVLASTLARGARAKNPSGPFAGEAIAIGTATDPYQPAERRFRVTRGILEVLATYEGLAVGIITKSPLITRDIDVLLEISRRSRLHVHVSLITLDRDLARRLEPRSPTPESRLRAIERLSSAGIDTGVNVMPVLPGITDNPGDIEALVRRVAEAGASHVGACALRLRKEARERYLPMIEAEFPHLAERYRTSYSANHELGDSYRSGLREFFVKACEKAGIRFGMERGNKEWRRQMELELALEN